MTLTHAPGMQGAVCGGQSHQHVACTGQACRGDGGAGASWDEDRVGSTEQTESLPGHQCCDGRVLSGPSLSARRGPTTATAGSEQDAGRPARPAREPTQGLGPYSQ